MMVFFILSINACDVLDTGDNIVEDEINKFEVMVIEPGVNLNEEAPYFTVEEAVVNLDEHQAITNNQGVAFFSNLKSGVYEITVAKSGYEKITEEIILDSNELTVITEIKMENSAELVPDEADYNILNPEDVSVEIDWQDADEITGLYRKINENNFEVQTKNEKNIFADHEIKVNNNQLIIKEEYIAGHVENEEKLKLFVKFDQGSDAQLTINIIEQEFEEEKEPQISPTEFDFFLDEPDHIKADIVWNKANEITDIQLEIADSNYQVQNNSDFQADNNMLEIDRETILVEEPEPGEQITITVFFDAGEPVKLTVFIKEKDSEEEEPDEEPDPEPGDITITGQLGLEHKFPYSVVEKDTAELAAQDLSSAELFNVDSKKLDSYRKEKKNEIIIRLSSAVPLEEAKEKVLKLGYQPIDFMPELNAMLAEIPENIDINKASTQIQEKPEILSVQSNNVFTLQDYQIPDDEYYDIQWAPSVMRLPQTWRDVSGTSNIRVAILDTGIDYNHLEMQELVDMDSGYDFSSDDETDFVDRQGHGTHVAGIVGAKANNGQGIAGVMWNVELLPVKVLSDAGSGDEWSVTQGILHAAGLREDSPIQKADVINLSLGMITNETPELMAEAVQKAADEGVVMVAASGNSGSKNISYPAKFADVIAVGALENNESGPPVIADYSSYGPELDLTAPGSEIWSTIPDDQLMKMSGTSMAAPQVAGLAGLMISEGINHENVLDVMQQTAIDLGESGFNDKYGYGMINTYWASYEATELNIVVGQREDRKLNIIAQTSVPINEDNYILEDIPTGYYEVMAWLDIRNSGNLENGDYFYSTGLVNLKEGTYSFDLTLEEFKK